MEALCAGARKLGCGARRCPASMSLRRRRPCSSTAHAELGMAVSALPCGRCTGEMHAAARAAQSLYLCGARSGPQALDGGARALAVARDRDTQNRGAQVLDGVDGDRVGPRRRTGGGRAGAIGRRVGAGARTGP
jgi:hypothetical protein